MENNFEVKSTLVAEDRLSKQRLTNNRVKALKSLAMMLLHEVEFLEDLTPHKNISLPEDNLFSLASEVEQFEIEWIRNALIQSRGHQINAAKILGIKMTTLNMKLKRYGIDARAFIAPDAENHD
ncbi:MAG TPA: helix-turn-helix domain-containing protein [Pyrinomonadaceae bacterium]